MRLEQISEHTWYLPPDDQKDRPMLGYVKGEKFSLAIDGGFSPDQVEGFYKELKAANLPKPDFTALTHWHWDHTLGLPAVSGLVIAEERTNDLLREERKRLVDPSYEKRLRMSYIYVDEEFPNVPIPTIRTGEIEFHDHLTLDPGGVRAELFHVEAPHTPDSTLIYIPEDKVLFLGDASLSSFETGRMDREKMNALLETVRNLDCQAILLGHEGLLSKEDFLYYNGF